MQFKDFEAWVWTELLAFDNTREDCGAAEYFAELGFVPAGICLMTSSPDFVLSHPGKLTGRVLPADVCARDGQPGNERRKRQEWTDLQLKKLVENLTSAGSQVYCSMFCVYQENRFTDEWLSRHPEIRLCWASYWRGQEINPIGLLEDGMLFEDVWIPKLIDVCRDYGFSGWHGPDGWGPWASGNIVDVDFSDSMMGQFMPLHNDWDWPDCFKPISRIVTMSEVLDAQKNGLPKPDYGMAQLKERADWICSNHFEEWRDFLAGRWVEFWKKALDALHAAGLKGVINSAWTKGCFDALNEYGVDYRRMAELGMDAMVVETVALGMSMIRPDISYMYDGLPMAMAEIKAAVPEMKLIMLHGIKDVVEFWDNLRQAPAAYERELYKLSSLFVKKDGKLIRASSGLLGCLADGISVEEWKYMSERWCAAFAGNPVSAGMSVLYFDGQAYGDSHKDYSVDAFPPALDQIVTLMEHGLPLQTFIGWNDAIGQQGVLVVPGAHLLEKEKLNALLTARNGVTVLVGRSGALEACGGFVLTDGSISVVIVNSGFEGRLDFEEPEHARSGPGHDSVYFYERRYRKEISPELWKTAVRKILETAADVPFIDQSSLPCSILFRKFSEKEYEIAVDARAEWGRASAVVAMPGNIALTKVLSPFPPRVMWYEGNKFKVPVPPRGVTVVKVILE